MMDEDTLHKLVDAQREKDLQELPILTLGELLISLKALELTYETHNGENADKHVYFNFGSLVPTKFASWRGVYAEVALGYGLHGYDGDAEAPTLRDFITEVEYAISATYTSWKGGDFKMNKRTPVWIDNEGNYTETMLVGVRSNKYRVILIGVQKEQDY